MGRTSHNAPDTARRPWHWTDDSACKGHPVPTMWSVEGPAPAAVAMRREAKRICHGCTVIDKCLGHALTMPENFGVWGGLEVAERDAMVWPGRLRLDPGGGGEGAGAQVEEEVPAA